MGQVRFKPGVVMFQDQDGNPLHDEGGDQLYAAIERVAAALPCDLVITSGCDGEHSGFEDPHHKARAFDVRTHDLPEDIRADLPTLILGELLEPGQAVIPKDGGFVTPWYYVFLEAAGTANEHLHAQVRKFVTVPAP